MSFVRTLAPVQRRLLLALICLLGLAGRLAPPAMSMPAITVAPLLDVAICHADPDDHRPHDPSQPAPACQLCPACFAVAHSGLPPPPVLTPPEPKRWTVTRRPSRVDAVSPPRRIALSFRSRAPPTHSG